MMDTDIEQSPDLGHRYGGHRVVMTGAAKSW